MRITTGKYKGRDILGPVGIRPTQNIVRKALFDILGGVDGLSFLELFAGSGAVGFEALSRGARELTLVESNHNCQLAIKKSIELLSPESCILIPLEADKAVESFFRKEKKFDVIFLDPPYCKEMAAPNLKGKAGVPVSPAKNTLQTLEAYDILSPNGLIVLQHFKRENLPDDLGVLSLFRQSKYGDTLLSFYEKRAF